MGGGVGGGGEDIVTPCCVLVPWIRPALSAASELQQVRGEQDSHCRDSCLTCARGSHLYPGSVPEIHGRVHS